MAFTTIFHNPACGTSRNTLALIRNSGIEPEVIDYQITPPGREKLRALAAELGLPVRAMLRRKGTPYDELALDNPALNDDALIDAMVAHPILMERPIVITALGCRICRPPELVLDLLSEPQLGAFRKEDGEQVVNAQGERVSGA